MRKPASTTRRRILDAAYEQFYRKGFTRVSVDEVAAQAKVTKRTLYYHFKSKDDLLASVLDLHHEMAIARVHKHESRYAGDPDHFIERTVRIKQLSGTHAEKARIAMMSATPKKTGRVTPFLESVPAKD